MRPRTPGLLATLVLAACGGNDAASPTGGRFTIRAAGVEVLDAPARAQVCERDSTLVVLAIGEEWSAAAAVRTAWPLEAPATFAVRGTLDSLGTGMVAVRPVGDSIAPARSAQAGALHLEPGPRVTGSFDVVTVGAGGDSVALAGRFRDLPVLTGRCPE